MNKHCLRTIAIFSHNIEQLIRENFRDCKAYCEQKILMDLMLSVVNYKHYFEKQKDK